MFGATPQRDAAVIGLGAKTNVGEATKLYLRYDAQLASGFNTHALTAGLSFTW